MLRKPRVGVEETNGWGPRNQLSRSRKTMAGAQETNSWGPGNQWLGTRTQMVRPQGIDRCVPPPQWDQTHPHGPLGTHGQLPYVPPRFTSSATRAIFQPATVRCIGLSRLYGHRVRGIASSPAVIMAQLQAFKADQIRAGCSAAPYTNSYFPCLLNRCAG